MIDRLRTVFNRAAFIGVLVMLMETNVLAQAEKDGEQESAIPEKGFSITLSVYSGRPNPQWWITEGPEFDKLVDLLKELQSEEKAIFNYKEWNRLGYASFWVVAKNVDGVPHKIHIWRDKATVVAEKRAKAKQAVGATPIYDMLVDQATNRKHKQFFQSYLEAKKLQEKKE